MSGAAEGDGTIQMADNHLKAGAQAISTVLKRIDTRERQEPRCPGPTA